MFETEVFTVLAGLRLRDGEIFRDFSGDGIIGIDHTVIGPVRYCLRVMAGPTPPSRMMGAVQRIPANLELPKAKTYRLQLEDKVHHLAVSVSVVNRADGSDIVTHWVYETGKQSGKHNILLMPAG